MQPPLVGFFIGAGSQTWQRIEKTGSFGVNVLSDEQADLSNGFFRKKETLGKEQNGSQWHPALQ